MRREMYWGAGSLTGFLYLTPSCHRYSNLDPPDMVGQLSRVHCRYSDCIQNSIANLIVEFYGWSVKGKTQFKI